MGRWGWRLFEGDQDLDVACCLAASLGFETNDWEYSMSSMVHQTDMLAGEAARAFYRTEEYKRELENDILPYVRAKLDTDNLGYRLFATSRTQENGQSVPSTAKYRTIVLGALMMRAGARIRPEDLQHLKDLVPQVHCNSQFVSPSFDEGFRTPGRAQFLAALDHYQAGVPRNYQEPSCFQCGQVKADIEHDLVQCARCYVAYYCDKECQRRHWQEHKASCASPEERRMVNI
ncbi:hypothetical protein BDV38DRAFT_278662 [Aspergillus pseudotamarii]|uniref:MYND-type domain-containing protein n=1 Tax=Aspergillus pseudotamarii TaxID=132259 RepID=A0A5N6T6L9_ASPPS|nr:uncharacterized protein BDV38DRAFT_278662 [Aspergillus pseudotamarii]KAE8141879.1 hypothetical protein BDV38DRAFT_278662 [Aspergillus pseudotamarii]